MGKFKHSGKPDFKRSFGRKDFGRPRFGGRDGNDREMFQTVCSECGKNCEVPFRPTGNKPVFCNDCFRKQNGDFAPRSYQDRPSRRPDFERKHESRPQNNEQLEAISRKLDKMIDLLSANLSKGETKPKKETPKKTTPKKKPAEPVEAVTTE